MGAHPPRYAPRAQVSMRSAEMAGQGTLPFLGYLWAWIVLTVRMPCMPPCPPRPFALWFTPASASWQLQLRRPARCSASPSALTAAPCASSHCWLHHSMPCTACPLRTTCCSASCCTCCMGPQLVLGWVSTASQWTPYFAFEMTPNELIMANGARPPCSCMGHISPTGASPQLFSHHPDCAKCDADL